MFRGLQKQSMSFKTHPDIIHIPVYVQNKWINGKLPPPKISANEEKESEEGNGIVNGAAAKNDDDEKPKKLPDALKMKADYNFESQTLRLCLNDSDFRWSLVSLEGVYNFTKAVINQNSFEEINVNAYNDSFLTKTFKLDISKIDRHIFMKKFTVVARYIFIDDVDMKLYKTEYSFEVPTFKTETTIAFKFLDHYHANDEITKLYNYDFKDHHDLSPSDLEFLYKIDRYQRQKVKYRTADETLTMLWYALNIEDLSSQDELKRFSLRYVDVDADIVDNYFESSIRENYFTFTVWGKELPEQVEEMTICLVPMYKYREGHINFEYDCVFAQVEKIKNGLIHIYKSFPRVRRGLHPRENNFLTETHHVRFIPNRITFRACLNALQSIHLHELQQFFGGFEEEPMWYRRDNGAKVENFEWYNQQIATNEEQMTAIKNIVNCTAYPFPYVVFGPPGTGKTSCIVECIAQILKAKPKARIMVTAQSNSACDEVGVRLLNYIPHNKIFRYYSPSILKPNSGETSEVLRATSNLRSNRYSFPTKEEFSHFNVVIATLMSCSRIVQIDGIEINRHFDYIFVDECGAAMEPEAMVPIIGLGTASHRITANIVLFGDHKQLGPVISSDFAGRLGLDVSLMERIMSKRRYRFDTIDKSYDSNYVTQLLDNFRSHPAILQFSNVLFYESMLRAKITEPEKSFGTKWNCLTNKKFPVLFHCIKTASETVYGGRSSYNTGELEKVRSYVDMLLKLGIDGKKVEEKDIGIVSPYKAQLNMLRETLAHAKDVEIGTAEYYQGREKKIIIISTVKSQDGVGFLKSEKRLNVCITRAKSLLILVGNAETLQKNSLWNSFLHFCKANDGVCGELFTLTSLTEEEQKIMDELNSVFNQLTVEDEDETATVVDRQKALKAIEDRMKIVEELMKPM